MLQHNYYIFPGSASEFLLISIFFFLFLILRSITLKTTLNLSGSDGIPGSILKEYADILAYSLAVLFCASLRTGVVLSAFKVASVVPLCKSRDPSPQISDLFLYSPISLNCLRRSSNANLSATFEPTSASLLPNLPTVSTIPPNIPSAFLLTVSSLPRIGEM